MYNTIKLSVIDTINLIQIMLLFLWIYLEQNRENLWLSVL